MGSLRALGERKVIDLILRLLEAMPGAPIPFGDDVSAYPLTGDWLAVLKTDMLVSKTDVPAGMSLWQAARKAVVMNVSDFAAKGVEPKAALVSLGLPGWLTETDVEDIGKGLNAGAREYGAYIVGGDTNESSDLIIALHLLGLAKRGSVMLRSGARPADLVATTGPFGKPAAGLKILIEGFEAPQSIREPLVESVLMPRARLKEGLALSRTGAVTSSIDSSDGLAWSLHEIAKASGVGFVINRLPVAAEVKEFAAAYGLDPFELAFYGGEEYELVVTIKPELWALAGDAVKATGGTLIPIGRTTADKQIFLEVNGERRPIEPRGWEHFK